MQVAFETDEPKTGEEDDQDKRYLPAKAGWNTFVWNMRTQDGIKVEGKDISAALTKGPQVPPGSYQLTLKAGGQTISHPVELLKDPRIDSSPEDFAKQYDLLIKLRDKHSQANSTINRIRNLKQQADDWAKRVEGHEGADAIRGAVDNLKDKLKPIEEVLIVPGLKKQQDITNNGARVASKLAALTPVVAISDTVPTTQAVEVYEHLAGQVDEVITQLQSVIDSDVTAP